MKPRSIHAGVLFAGMVAMLPLAAASAAPRPVVVELFTSQACSDCPPADALLRRVQEADPAVLALDLHVTYFNGTGWTDPFSFIAVTDRQYWYASVHHTTDIYTPQAVIDGRMVTVGSRRNAILSAIDIAKQEAAKPQALIDITPEKSGWRISVHGEAPKAAASVVVFSFDDVDRTPVRGGENSGVELTEIHVVRSIALLGGWNGGSFDRQVQAGTGAYIAVLVQQADGTILGAARS